MVSKSLLLEIEQARQWAKIPLGDWHIMPGTMAYREPSHPIKQHSKSEVIAAYRHDALIKAVLQDLSRPRKDKK